MTGFAHQEDLRRYVGGIFDIALTDPVIGPKLTATGLVFRVRTTDPAGVLTVDLPNRRIDTGDSSLVPDATMTMSSDLANRFWQGKVNLTFAMARGQVRVEGKIASLLKLLPSTKSLFPVYIRMLEDDDRRDLLAD